MAFYIWFVKYRFHNVENQTTYAQIIYYYSALFFDIFHFKTALHNNDKNTEFNAIANIILYVTMTP